MEKKRAGAKTNRKKERKKEREKEKDKAQMMHQMNWIKGTHGTFFSTVLKLLPTQLDPMKQACARWIRKIL